MLDHPEMSTSWMFLFPLSTRKCDDALFEALNMLINVALWFTKHAAKIAGAKDEPSMDEAKEVHKCLRKAAGIFKFIKENVGRLLQVRRWLWEWCTSHVI